MNTDRKTEIRNAVSKVVIERLIADEYDTIEKLKQRKRDIDEQIDRCIAKIDQHREVLNKNVNI